MPDFGIRKENAFSAVLAKRMWLRRAVFASVRDSFHSCILCGTRKENAAAQSCLFVTHLTHHASSRECILCGTRKENAAAQSRLPTNSAAKHAFESEFATGQPHSLCKYRSTRGGGLGSRPIFKNLMSPTPHRKWYLTTGRRAH